MQAKLIVAALTSALILSGCQTMLDSAREAEVDALPYSEAGHQEYLRLAEVEADRGDRRDEVHFAQHSQVAATGDVFGPDTVGSRDLPDGSVEQVQGALADLLDAFDRGARTQNPGPSARAQASFDCWIERLEEGADEQRIAECREAFFAALGKARKGLSSRQPDVQEAAAAPEEPEVMTDAGPERYVLYFPFDSSEIRPEALRELNAIVRSVEGGDRRLFVTGHADRAGSEDYNTDLSMARAQAVKQAMVRRGLSSERIGLAARGEGSPAVETPDNVREPKNRRVEVTIE